MLRLACVDVPALPLQLLLIEHPDWRGGPVAVVAEDNPQAPLLYVTEQARRAGNLPGQRFSAALALAKDLRAGTVSDARVRRCVVTLTERLRRYSPSVEPDSAVPGVFWLDAGGLARLYPRLDGWARDIAADLRGVDLAAAVVVGFTRFGTYAVARTGRGIRVFARPEEEQAAVRGVPLARLDLDPDARDRLAALAVRTIDDLLRLPAEGIRRRFGDAAWRLHRLAAGARWDPLLPAAPVERHEREIEMEAPEADAERLLFVVKRQLDDLLSALARHAEALAELRLRLKLYDGGEARERLVPAAPTLDGVQILGLVRLRLERRRLTAGVVAIRLAALTAPATPRQVHLFAEQARRDAEAVERAFARLRAEFGNDVVVRASLHPAHLPQARFAWQPLAVLPAEAPAPRVVIPPPLIRRLYARPKALPPRPRHEPDGWLLRGIDQGRVERLHGPYVVSGGWWRSEVRREYYFAQTSRGELLWIYHDRKRRRFFLEGRVE